MSYSRWSNSAWYSFWSSNSGTSRDEQVLSLWYSIDQSKDWLYQTLKTWSVADVLNNYTDVTEDEAIVAYQYIQQWLRDVEKEFDESED